MIANKAKSFLIRVLLFQVTALLAVSCQPNEIHAEPKVSLTAKVCIKFKTERAARQKIVSQLRELEKKFDGKTLIEKQGVYFKVSDPEIYIIYDDKMSAYGNLVQIYWVDPKSDTIANAFSKFIYENYEDGKDCSTHRTSAISPFDF